MAPGGWAWMAEVAGEELAKLEASHPGRHGPLKAELQRLAAEPGLDAALSPCAGATPSSQQVLHLSCTQESSTRKRKPAGAACELKDGKRRSATAAAASGATKDRAEMAIERAERCLERIRAIKRSLLAAWTR